MKKRPQLYINESTPIHPQEDPDHESSEALAVGERDYALFNDRIWPALYRR